MGRKTVMNDLTTPEEIAAYNSENRQLKEDFLEYLRSTQRSPGTLKGYNSDLDIFFVWNMKYNGDKSFVNLTKRNIVAFQNWLITENKNSPARVRRIKSALSSFSNYIENICDDEYENFRPIIRKIENPVNTTVREKTVLTREQLDYLLDTLVKQGNEQIACCIALAAFSGRRKSELVRFKVSYFDESNVYLGSLYKTPEKIKTKGRGLGKYIYCYTLKHDFQPYLDLWLEKRARLGIENEELFVVKHGNGYTPATDQTVSGWAEQCERILGVPFYMHSLRHFFTTQLSSEKNLPDEVIKKLVGWDRLSPIVVIRYANSQLLSGKTMKMIIPRIRLKRESVTTTA